MNKFLLTLFVVFFTLSVSAQIDEKEKLEQRKEQLQRELSEAKTKLQNEKKKEKSVLKEIAGQEAQIKISEKSKIIKNEIVGLKQEKQSEIKSATEKKNVTENKTGK